MLGNEYLRQVWVHVVATAAFPFFLAQTITVKTIIFNHIKSKGAVVWGSQFEIAMSAF